MTDETAMPADPKLTKERVSFFTLNPCRIGRSRLVRALAIGLFIVAFSVVPLWRLLWYFPVYGATDFIPVRDSNGHWGAAWHWIDGKEIRVYTRPGLPARDAETIRSGVQAMVDEVPLDFTVKLMPMSAELQQAYQQSLITHGTDTRISYKKLAAHAIALRQGDPHADIFIADEPINECWWAHGMSSFTYGVAILERQDIDFHLGKHETCHLLGYHYHDTLPLFVFGYHEGAIPWQRDTLMLLYGSNNTELSDRARDALRYFWRGMERRSHKKFLVPGS